MPNLALHWACFVFGVVSSCLVWPGWWDSVCLASPRIVRFSEGSSLVRSLSNPPTYRNRSGSLFRPHWLLPHLCGKENMYRVLFSSVRRRVVVAKGDLVLSIQFVVGVKSRCTLLPYNLLSCVWVVPAIFHGRSVFSVSHLGRQNYVQLSGSVPSVLYWPGLIEGQNYRSTFVEETMKFVQQQKSSSVLCGFKSIPYSACYRVI